MGDSTSLGQAAFSVRLEGKEDFHVRRWKGKLFPAERTMGVMILVGRDKTHLRKCQGFSLENKWIQLAWGRS